jgi:hypothetical protein
MSLQIAPEVVLELVSYVDLQLTRQWIVMFNVSDPAEQPPLCESSTIQSICKNVNFISSVNTHNDFKSNYNALKQKKGLKCLHLNVVTLLPKIDEIKHLLLDLDIDIFSLNETRLDSDVNDACLALDGYSLFRKDRSRSGGGVALYVRNSLSPDECSFKTSSESLFVKCKFKS